MPEKGDNDDEEDLHHRPDDAGDVQQSRRERVTDSAGVRRIGRWPAGAARRIRFGN